MYPRLLIHKVTVAFQVLHPDGQHTAIAGFEVFRGNLPGQEWYAYVKIATMDRN